MTADWLESLVWSDCAAYARNPDSYLDDAQRQLRERLAKSVDNEPRRRDLLRQIADKQVEKDRVLTLYRRGRIMLDDADKQLDDVARETATLRDVLESLRAHEALTQAAEAHLTSTATALAQVRETVDEIDAMRDSAEKHERQRSIIERLVLNVRIHTDQRAEHTRGKRRAATVAVEYAHRAPTSALTVVPATARHTGHCGCSARVGRT